MFEPIHGSYPQATGKGIANPIASILSAAMLLDHFELYDEAKIIRKAVDKSLKLQITTPDLNKKFDIVIPYADFKKKKDKSAVKIISNQQNKILMMSRSDVPCYYVGDSKPMLRHQDFISFKKKALLDYTKLKPTLIEKIEKIELLRAIENEMILGTMKVKVLNDVNSLNTKEDLRFIKKFIHEQKKII